MAVGHINVNSYVWCIAFCVSIGDANFYVDTVSLGVGSGVFPACSVNINIDSNRLLGILWWERAAININCYRVCHCSLRLTCCLFNCGYVGYGRYGWHGRNGS